MLNGKFLVLVGYILSPASRLLCEKVVIFLVKGKEHFRAYESRNNRQPLHRRQISLWLNSP